MNKRSQIFNLLEMNLAILFISTSGVLGRYIDLPVPVIIALRSIIGAIILFLYCRYRKLSLRVKKDDALPIFISGILMGIHWITYFFALKYSNVAIAMLSLYTFPAITAILEPLFLKTKLLKSHILMALLIMLGIYFLVPEFDIESNYSKAILFGLVSAVSYAIRNIIMKAKVSSYNGSVLMVHQLLVISILLIPAYFLQDTSQVLEYLPATLLLGLLTTAIGHTLFLHSLKNFSTVSASIVSSLQPIYGILLALLFLSEYPAKNTLIGGLLIISTVLLEALRMKSIEKIQRKTLGIKDLK